jgi:DNA-binding MarR family transcriptional regulator
MPRHGHLDVDGLRALQRTTHELNKGLEDELAELGLSAVEAHALVCFEDDEPRRMRELIAATALRPSTLTGVVDRLERRGLLQRAIDPRDRRAFHIHPTAEGAEARDAVQRAYGAIAERAARILDDDQDGALLQGLAAVEHAARRD